MRSLETFVLRDAIPLSPGFVSNRVHFLLGEVVLLWRSTQCLREQAPERAHLSLRSSHVGLKAGGLGGQGLHLTPALQRLPASQQCPPLGVSVFLCLPWRRYFTCDVFTCTQGRAHRTHSHRRGLLRVLSFVLSAPPRPCLSERTGGLAVGKKKNSCAAAWSLSVTGI